MNSKYIFVAKLSRNIIAKLLLAYCIIFSTTMIGPSNCWAQLTPNTNTRLYYGEMDVGPRIFRFVVTGKLDATQNKWTAELQSLDEGGSVFQLSQVTLDGENLKFELPQTKAVYSASRQDGDKSTFKGNWQQSGGTFALDFRQVDAPPVDSPKEVWVGDLNAGIQVLKMQFRFYETSDGKQQLLVDSLSQNVGGLKANRTRNDSKVEIDVSSLRGKFTGDKVDDNTISGTWTQGVPLKLDLKKIDRPLAPESLAKKRPQTPKAPFNYDIEQVEFRSSAINVTLSGTLLVPNSKDPNQKFPAAILVSGSGPQDRDETLLGHKPFWILADYLARKGIAVLRYDDRGIARSTGDFGQATTQDFADDATSAVKFLAQHSKINSKQIGIIGHSEGGIVAPLVASNEPQVAWIVLMAGTGVNGEQILYSQGKLIILAAGGSEDGATKNRLVQEVCVEAVKQLKPGDDTEPLLQTTVTTLIERAKKLDGEKQPEKESDEASIAMVREVVGANLKALNTPWMRFFTRHEPGPVLEKVRCPVLAINGAKDVQVDPLLNLPKIEASLKAGGNKDFQIVTLPELNHLFQTCKTGALGEYETIEETISPVALKAIGDWISAHTSP